MHFTALLLHRSGLFRRIGEKKTKKRRKKRKEEGINTSAGDSSSPKASESTALRERRARWDVRRGRRGGCIRISLLLVNILAAYDLVSDPVENVKNEEDQRKGHTRHCVDPFGTADEELAHFLHSLLRGVSGGGRVVVVALDCHAVFGLKARWTHAVGCEAESAVSCLVLLQYSTQVSIIHTFYLIAHSLKQYSM